LRRSHPLLEDITKRRRPLPRLSIVLFHSITLSFPRIPPVVYKNQGSTKRITHRYIFVRSFACSLVGGTTGIKTHRIHLCVSLFVVRWYCSRTAFLFFPERYHDVPDACAFPLSPRTHRVEWNGTEPNPIRSLVVSPSVCQPCSRCCPHKKTDASSCSRSLKTITVGVDIG